MTWWIRAYLVFAAIQGLGIGLTGLFVPAEMQIPLRLSPLNARFVAALYVAGGFGVLWGAVRARKHEESRLFILAFGLATALILAVTLTHWSDFMADPLPHRAVWIFVYVTDPLLALLLVPLAGLWPARTATSHRLTPLLQVEALVFGALGLVLLLVPDVMAAFWPWTLPPVAGQVYGCFFLTFAIGALLAARESEIRAVNAFAVSTLLLAGLVLVASALHLDRFKPEPITWIWFALFALTMVGFALALLTLRDRQLRRTAAVVQ